MENSMEHFAKKILSNLKESDFFKKGLELDNTKPRKESINYFVNGCKQDEKFDIWLDTSIQERHFEDCSDEPLDIVLDSIYEIVENMTSEEFDAAYMSITEKMRTKIINDWTGLLNSYDDEYELKETILERYIEICFIEFLKSSEEDMLKLSFKDSFDDERYKLI